MLKRCEKKTLTIVRRFADKVRETYPTARIWAFGSHVRGTASKDSDLLVFVVIPEIGPDDRFAVSDMAWEVGFAHDLHLSTVVVSEEDFERGALCASPLLETVRKEGVAA